MEWYYKLFVQLFPTNKLTHYVQRGLYWLRNIYAPLKESYKEDLKWWFGVELERRLLILLLIVPLPCSIRNLSCIPTWFVLWVDLHCETSVALQQIN